MKIIFLPVILFFTILLHAQEFHPQPDISYPPLSSMLPFRSFQLKPDGSWNKLSKYSSYKLQLFDDASGNWNNTDSVVCFYNDQMLMTMQVDYKFVDTSWQKFKKAELIIDNKGSPLSTTVYKWQKQEDNWQNDYQKDYVFDTCFRLIMEREKRWIPELNAFYYRSKNKYQYDATGNEVLDLKQEWNPGKGIWVNSEKEVSVFDSTNRLLSARYQFWNSENQDWGKGLHYNYTYDKAGNKLTELVRRWKTDRWQNETLDSNTYDTLNRQIGNEWQRWDTSAGGKWVSFGIKNWLYQSIDNLKSCVETNWGRYKKQDTARRVGRDIRLFDADSNMVTHYTMDIYKCNWSSHYRDSAAYDNQGNIIYYQ